MHVDLAGVRQRLNRGFVHRGGGGEELRIGVHVLPLLVNLRRKRSGKQDARLSLSYAGIIQIRFEGMSHLPDIRWQDP